MDKFSELKAAAMAATSGPWEWFTSNSMARLSSIPSGQDGDVMSAFLASDGVPCVSVSQPDMAFIAAANPAVVLALLARIANLEAKLATPVRLTKPCAFNLCDLVDRDAVIASLREQGFTVEGDE